MFLPCVLFLSSHRIHVLHSFSEVMEIIVTRKSFKTHHGQGSASKIQCKDGLILIKWRTFQKYKWQITADISIVELRKKKMLKIWPRCNYRFDFIKCSKPICQLLQLIFIIFFTNFTHTHQFIHHNEKCLEYMASLNSCIHYFIVLVGLASLTDCHWWCQSEITGITHLWTWDFML